MGCANQLFRVGALAVLEAGIEAVGLRIQRTALG